MPIETIRREMTYVLLDSQFTNLTRLNTAALICFNLASLCFAVFFGMLTGWLFADHLSDSVLLATKVIAVIFAGAALILLIGGLVFFFQRWNDEGKIRKATKAKDPTVIKPSA